MTEEIEIDQDDDFGPYLCTNSKQVCNPARDHCRCWWLSENPEHWQRLAAIKIAGTNGEQALDKKG